MSYRRYLEFKRDFVSVLSLINGAEVKIRKEFTGTYTTERFGMQKLSSEVEVLYSFNTIQNTRRSKYLPIKDPYEKGLNLFNIFFLNNFNNFRKWSKILELNTVIFFLSTAHQANSMEGRFFVQMIALEKLATNYANHLGRTSYFSPDKDTFSPIQEELLRVLESNKKKFGKHYNSAKSKICNLNRISNGSTVPKMYRLLQDFNVPIGKKTEEIIEVVRHRTIHEGSIAEDFESKALYFQLMDELIREIILRVVGYEGPRKQRFLGK